MVCGDKDDADESEGEDEEDVGNDGDEEIEDDEENDDVDGNNVDGEADGTVDAAIKDEGEHEDCNDKATADGTTGVGGPWTFLVW